MIFEENNTIWKKVTWMRKEETRKEEIVKDVNGRLLGNGVYERSGLSMSKGC